MHALRLDDPERKTHHARYTLRERRKDMRVAQYAFAVRTVLACGLQALIHTGFTRVSHGLACGLQAFTRVFTQF